MLQYERGGNAKYDSKLGRSSFNGAVGARYLYADGAEMEEYEKGK